MIGSWFIGILVVCLIIALFAGVYFLKKVQTIEDYYVAGQDASPVLVAGSWAATWISGGALVGIVGVAYTVGYSAIMTWVFAIWVLPISFWFIVKKVRHLSEKWSAMTWCEMLGKRYDSPFLRVFMAFSIILFIFFAMVAQLKIGGLVFEVAGLAQYNVAVVLTTLIIIFFVGLGGMKSVLWTDTFLAITMCIAILIMFFTGLSKIGGLTGLEQSLLADPAALKFASLTGFNEGANFLVNLLSSPNAFDLRPNFGEFSLLGTIGWGLALAIGSAALPHQATRFFAVKRLDKPVFQKLMLWTTIFIMILSLSIFFGVIGRGILGPDYIGNADYVTPFLAIEILPIPFAAFILAAIMFAIVTTVSTFLYVIITTISRDVLQSGIWKNASDSQILLTTRVLAFVVGFLAMIFAITNPPEMMMLLHYLVQPGLGFTFFFTLIVGFYWNGATKWGAIATVIGVTITTIVLRFIFGWPQGPMFFVTFLLSLVLFVGISFITTTSDREKEIGKDLFFTG